MNNDWGAPYNKFITALFAGNQQIANILVAVAVALAAFAIVKFVWDKRRGGAGNNKNLLWTLVIAAILTAPTLLGPVLTGVGNIVQALLKAITSIL